MVKSRARPATVEAASAPPPAKRRKGAIEEKSQTNGFENILLNKKGNKPLPTARATKANGTGNARVNEEKVVVNTANGHDDVRNNVVDISSNSSSSDDEEDEEIADSVAGDDVKVNGVPNGVDAMEEDEVEEDALAGAERDVDAMEEEDDSFGAQVARQYADPIDVEAELAKQEESSSEQEAASKKPSKALTKAPSGATFSTVLTQALRTNDNSLLETCFTTNDLESVRETLSRMDSRLVVSLMQRIAERISKAPGRLGNLMVWIQWAVIAHGGYLAGQPDISKKLASLHRVIEARAQGLQPLLQLKGKLDMLAAQYDLRRDEIERTAKNLEDEEGAVTIYVEGENDEDEDSESGSDDFDDANQQLLLNGIGGESDEDEGAFAKGVVRGDVSDSEEDSEEEGLFDEEASETDDDESDEEEKSDEEEESD